MYILTSDFFDALPSFYPSENVELLQEVFEGLFLDFITATSDLSGEKYILLAELTVLWKPTS